MATDALVHVHGVKAPDGRVWLITAHGQRLGPFRDMDDVLDALGTPNPENEALADAAWALMIPVS